MRSWLSHSEDDTEALGERLANELRPDGVVLLTGDMGSGKTVLVRGLARALGIDQREIQSPTYTLIHEHQGVSGRLVHIDLYRLEPESEDPGAWESLGLDELLAGEGIKAVEWAERLERFVPGALGLELRAGANGEREIRETAVLAPIETKTDRSTAIDMKPIDASGE